MNGHPSTKRKLIAKVALLLFPFLTALAVELFALPIDTFCFRVSESLQVYRLNHLLPGPFYPSRHIERSDEVGNLGVYTRFAVKRKVLWITDRYGYRFDDQRYSGETFDVVVVGDSNVQGAGLTQSDMLDVQLSRDLGRPVYPYGSYSLNDFLNDARFKKYPPKMVVYCQMEHNLPNVPAKKLEAAAPHHLWNSSARDAFILVDRALKCTMLHYAQSALRRSIKGLYYQLRNGGRANQEPLPFYAVPATDHSMLFWVKEIHPIELPDAEIETIAQSLQDYKQEFESQGIQFIFLPTPNKTSVYYPLVPLKSPPDFLNRFVAATQRHGVRTVDTLPAFQEAASRGRMLYQSDDIHWGPEGVALAAHLLEKEIASR